MKHLLRNTRAGFSMVELMVVVGISLLLSAIAIPNMLTAIATTRIRSNISTLSGIFQDCRMLAVKSNGTMSTHFTTQTEGIMAYVKTAGDSSALTKLDPQVELQDPILQYTTPSDPGVSALDNSLLGFTPQTGDVSFNSRGLPCAYSSGACTNNGFAYYFKDTRRTGSSGWAAISISPAGRIKRWFWTGTAWGN
jgi:prepilin-type N-terminal cleavage/methylation domain-containing protein